MNLPVIHVISDSVGVTAQAVARAAAAQFGVMDPTIEVLAKVGSFEEIRAFLEEHAQLHKELYGDPTMLVFYTLVDSETRDRLQEYLAQSDAIVAVDLMTAAVSAIAAVSGQEPKHKPGVQRAVNEAYFRRIEALEFAISHDDGRNVSDIASADIVLVGVSRSSKTPIAIYLAQQGLKVANVPLDPDTAPPKELFEVDRTRLFGLMTSAEVLAAVRKRRLGKMMQAAARYADLEYIYEDLDSARALMRKLGCVVIHTEDRGIEESAQEILRYYERNHPVPIATPLKERIDAVEDSCGYH